MLSLIRLSPFLLGTAYGLSDSTASFLAPVQQHHVLKESAENNAAATITAAEETDKLANLVKSQQSNVEVLMDSGKGRVLYTSRAFDIGEEIFEEGIDDSTIKVTADGANKAYEKLMELKEKKAIEYPALVYWAAVHTLTTSDVTFKGSDARLYAWPTASRQVQEMVFRFWSPWEDSESKHASPSTVAVVEALWGSNVDAPYREEMSDKIEHLVQQWIYCSLVVGGTTQAFFPAAALLSHSCAPNATLEYSEQKYTLKAIRAIGAKEEVSICYLSGGDVASKSALSRRTAIHLKRGFVCKCKPCVTNKKGGNDVQCSDAFTWRQYVKREPYTPIPKLKQE